MATSIQDVLSVLRCPKTHTPLELQRGKLVSRDGITYAIRDGIVDFVDQDLARASPGVESAYERIGSLKYEFLILNPFWLMFLWGVGFLKAPLYMFKLLEISPGWTLDIPCGTGLFSTRIYRSHPRVQFVAVDYSWGMLRAAQMRARKKNIDNVIFCRADVANLPFSDGAFSGAISLAGFHAFPDPGAAGVEIGRTLISSAPLLVSVACRGVRRISDFMIDKYLVPQGYFSQALSPCDYQACLEKGGIRELDVKMAGALMIVKGRKGNKCSSR